MLIKKAYLGEFRHLLSILRLANLDNRCYVAFPKRKFKYVNIVKQLQDLGLIENFEERNEILIVHLKQAYWGSFAIPFKAFTDVESANSRLRKYRSAKAIEKNQLLQGRFVHTSITTDKGLLFDSEAARIKKGGLPLFQIS